LNRRGRNDAPEMATRLHQRQLIVDEVLCSSAQRTRETAALLQKIMGFDESVIRFEGQIYEASVQDLLQVIGTSTANALLLIGHNPGLELLCQTVAPGAVTSMPTCAVASFSFPAGDWAELLEQAATTTPATLNFHDYPKNRPDL